MKPIKEIEQLKAKQAMLGHLQTKYKVDPKVIEAARVKLAADLCDALSGALGIALLERLDVDITRLERGELQPGDLASWTFGSQPKISRVKLVEPNGVTVEAGGDIGDYRMNKDEAMPAADQLNELRAVKDACLAVR